MNGCPKKIIQLMETIRIDLVRYESEIVKIICELLTANGISYECEVRLDSRCRVDIMTNDGIVIEVKKGKPNSRTVAGQVRRYAGFDSVVTVVLVSERGLATHVTESGGKDIHYVALSKNWGLGI